MRRESDNRAFCYFLSIMYILIMILFIMAKTNYHTDEVYSYGLANHIYQDSIDPSYVEGYQYKNKQLWMDYVTVAKAHRFDYKNVYVNQIHDVHPPLYYLILHTVCSLFPEHFSIWFAAVINMLCALALFWVVNRLLAELVEDRIICTIGSVLFICNPGILSAVCFMRMYMLVMLEVAVFAYLLVHTLLKHNKVNILSFCGVTFCGMLTHYYFDVFAVCAMAVYSVILLRSSRGKEAVRTIGLFLCSGLASVICFPWMIKHFFRSSRGTETMHKMIHVSIGSYLKKCYTFFQLLSRDMFGCVLIVLVLAMVIVGLYMWKKHIFNVKELSRDRVQSFVFLLVSSGMYFMIISQMAVFECERYLYPVYGVYWVEISSLLLLLAKKGLGTKIRYCVMSTGAVVFVLISIFTARWDLLYRNSKPLVDWAREHKELNCIYVLANDGQDHWKLNPEMVDGGEYESVTIVSEANLDDMDLQALFQENSVVVKIDSEIEDKDSIISKMHEKIGDMGDTEYIGSYFYMDTYWLSK